MPTPITPLLMAAYVTVRYCFFRWFSESAIESWHNPANFYYTVNLWSFRVVVQLIWKFERTLIKNLSYSTYFRNYLLLWMSTFNWRVQNFAFAIFFRSLISSKKLLFVSLMQFSSKRLTADENLGKQSYGRSSFNKRKQIDECHYG